MCDFQWNGPILLTAFTERVRNQIKQNIVTVKNTNFVVFFDIWRIIRLCASA